jgi:putative flippase GtrA
MPPQATPSAEIGRARQERRALWMTLGRHQLGATAATIVDFGTMIACVQLLNMQPTWGTGIGASLGAITNFTLGRSWIFPRHSGHVAHQALRYAMVSATSAGLNMVGEALLVGEKIQFVVARVMVSIAVSLCWNFPMQRGFVFRESRST